MDEENKKFYFRIVMLTLVFIVAMNIVETNNKEFNGFLSFSRGEGYTILFSNTTVSQLAEIYMENAPSEFVGCLSADNTINKNSITITSVNISKMFIQTEISSAIECYEEDYSIIHSHPLNGKCYPSKNDLLTAKKVKSDNLMIICGNTTHPHKIFSYTRDGNITTHYIFNKE